MDRVIIYPGQVPLEGDLLNTNKNAMIGLSKLSAALLGTGIVLNGFTCIPTGVASLQVQLTAGEIYSLQNIDGTAYSSIALDTAHQIVKQGILLDTVLLTATPPVTAGQSINYLVQATYADSDTNAVVLPYYNASNPSVAYSGPANAGTTNNTVRKGLATVSIKAGVTATTGSQVTPAPDSGYTGMFVVTVANGQTTITAPNISTLAGAPFVTETLLQKVGQASTQITATAAGTADALTATFTPTITSLVNGMSLIIRAASANTSATPTLKVDGTAIKTIVKGNNLPLVAGDIAGASHWLEFQYDLTLDKWVLQNAANGINPSVFTSKIQSISASVAANALTVGLNPATLDFRNSSLTNGAPNTRVIASALSLIVPSTVTLATVSAQQSRLALLAIDNGGTPELAIANLVGGDNLDETTLINTTAIATTCTFTGAIAVTTGILTLSATGTGTLALGMALTGTNVASGTVVKSLLTGTLGAAGSTYQTNQFTAAASTAMAGCAGIGIYSTTARIGQPFRVVGYVESTQATAGTWLTVPSTIQGMGGQALTSMSSLGYGQTWQNVTASRAVNTTYYNTTGRPIFVVIAITSTTGTNINVTVNGILTLQSGGNTTGTNLSGVLIVPPGGSYSFTSATGTPTLVNFSELR